MSFVFGDNNTDDGDDVFAGQKSGGGRFHARSSTRGQTAREQPDRRDGDCNRDRRLVA